MSKENKMIDVVKMYLSNNYSVIPVNAQKNPTIAWGQYMLKPMDIEYAKSVFKDAYGIALIMGGKKSLTAIDVDLKYDISGSLWDRLKKEIGKDLLKKMWVNKTVSGGFHLVFSCVKSEGNMKLASRSTTDEEKINTFNLEISKGSSAETALRAGLSDTSRVLIETRGVGGFIVVPPTPGYECVYGKIQEITPEEYTELIEICYSFNEYIKPVKNYAVAKLERDKGKDVFASFNKSADVVKMLEDFGWSQVGQDGTRIRMRRPGNVASKDSGWFDIEKRIFWVFSTSTSFKENEGYSAVDVLLQLKYDGDNSKLNEVYKELKENS